jgi:cytochrome P450
MGGEGGLRLNAAAPVLWRRAVKPFEFGGHTFPAGTITGVNPMLTHLLPEIWAGDPGPTTRPLLAERSLGRHRFAFVPFGGGAHGCLGANFAYLQVRALLRPCWRARARPRRRSRRAGIIGRIAGRALRASLRAWSFGPI